MKSLSLLTENQQAGVDRLYNHDHTLLVAAMGAGKTVVALTAAAELLRDRVLSRVLVIAPLAVASTVWVQESASWEHLAGLRVAAAVGSAARRVEVMQSDAQVIVINFELMEWLFREHPEFAGTFDGLVIDEGTRLTRVGGVWFKALRPWIKRFSWRVNMTGTPVTEHWQALYGQMLVVDGGRALGKRKEAFLRRYFYPTDYQNRNWALFPDSPEKILAAIRPWLFKLDDYRAILPDLEISHVYVDMPPVVAELHRKMAEDLSVDIADDTIVAGSGGVAVGKLQQIANGFLYPHARERTDDADAAVGAPIEISNYRVEVAMARVREKLADGERVILLYWYRADYARLRTALASVADGGLTVEAMTDLTGQDSRAELCGRWNRGAIDVLLLHPRSAGHGIRLEQGGHYMLWFGPPWSCDLWEQTIARVWRRGQKSPVDVDVIVARESIDEAILRRLDDKAENEAALSRAMSG